MRRTSGSHLIRAGERWWPWILLSILVVAALLRFPALDRVPPGFQFDEGYNAHDALRVLQGDRPIFLPENGGREVLYTYLQALAMALFGPNVVALRLTSAVLGLLTVAAVFFLVRLMWRGAEASSTLLGLLTAAIVAVTYWHVHFSRYGIRAISLPLLEVLLFYAFWCGCCVPATGGGLRRTTWWVLGGVLLGLGPYTHPAGRFLPFVLVAFVAYVGLSRRAWPRVLLSQLIVMGAIALLMFVPLGGYFAHNPDAFSGHAGLVSVFNREAAGSGAITALAHNVVDVLGMFAFRGDGAWNHNLAGRPVWDALMAACFAVGCVLLAIRLFRRSESTNGIDGDTTPPACGADRDPAVFWVLWLAVMFLPTLLSTGAPDFSRSTAAIPALCFLPALGLVSIVRWLGRERRLVAGAVVGAALCVTTTLTAYDYFVRFPQSPETYPIYDVDKIEVADHLREWAQTDTVYLSPLWFEHATLNFLTLGLGLKSFDSGETLVLPNRASGRDAVYVYSWEQTPYIDAFAERMGPLAERVDVPNRWGGQLLVTFHVPSGHLPDAARPLDSLADAGFGLLPAQRFEPPVELNGPVRLLGCTLPESIPAGAAGPLTLFWQATGPIATDYTVFVHALDRRDRRWGQDDRRPNQGGYPTTAWSAGDVVIDQYWPAIDPCAPAGPLELVAGLYDYATGERLRARSGLDGVPFGTVEVTPPQRLTLRDRTPAQRIEQDLDGLRLLGTDGLPESVNAGETLPLNLYWQARSDLRADVSWMLALRPDSGDAVTLGAFGPSVPTSTWRKGDGICTHHDVSVPREMAAGTYTLSLDVPGVPEPVTLGEVTVETPARAFALPVGLADSGPARRVDYRLGDAIDLAGYELPADAVRAGEALPVTLYWRANAPVDAGYTVFVHLLGDSGTLRAQRDTIPADGTRPTTGWLPGEVISDTIVLPIPADAAAGTYRVAVGMYRALDGRRLPVTAAGGSPIAGEQVVLDTPVEVLP